MKYYKQKTLEVKLKKYSFKVTEVEFLGFIVTTTGFKIDPGKVKAVQDWPEPTSVKEIQSFLRFANFYKRFIKDYSKVAILFTNFTKKDQKFSITSKAREAFQNLKKAFTKIPILVSFDLEKEIIVETDISDYTIRRVINQQGIDKK